MPSHLSDFSGDFILVNGKAWPVPEVEPRPGHLRLPNGSGSRSFDLGLLPGQEMVQVGTEQGLLDISVGISNPPLTPGERADAVADSSCVGRPRPHHGRLRHRLGGDAAHRRAHGRRHDLGAPAVDVPDAGRLFPAAPARLGRCRRRFAMTAAQFLPNANPHRHRRVNPTFLMRVNPIHKQYVTNLIPHILRPQNWETIPNLRDESRTPTLHETPPYDNRLKFHPSIQTTGIPYRLGTTVASATPDAAICRT